MAFKYTDKQNKAILHEGENILVSAGAGSGKTAVLTERVIRKLKNGVPVDGLIILTFTNAAAAEMKARIRKALLDNIAASPGLKDALEGLDSAHIRTFDSYAYYLLKKYGHLNHISKHLSIGDEATFTLKKEALIDELFETYCNNNDEAFLDYVSLFSYKDDAPAKKQILFFHDALSLHYDKEAFFEYTVHRYFSVDTFEKLFSEYEALVLEQVATMQHRLHKLFDEGFCEEIMAYLEKLNQVLTPLFQCKQYDCVHAFVKKGPKLPNTTGVTRKLKDTPEERELEPLKNETEAIKAILKKEMIGSPSDPGPLQKSKQDHYKGFMATENHIQTIVTILRDFDAAYMATQKEEEVFDFSTVARLALDLIHNHKSVKEELRSSTHEIMIDEYQDTNAMQEAFLETVGQDNLYMVGDVKQSIYRFRHADPTIFMKKYEAYKDGRGGILIDLTENFRSRKEVLQGINRLFEAVMDETVGGVAYDERQALIASNPVYKTQSSKPFSYGVNILSYKEETHEDLLETFSKKELEMFMLAHDIKQTIESGVEIIGEDGLRPITYGDHAVLVDRGTDFETFKKVFEYVGVPLNIHRNARFIDHDEVILMRQLFTLIAAWDDPELYHASFRHAFMSVMRSFAFEVDDNAIIKQVMALPPRLRNSLEASQAHFLERFKPFFIKLKALRDSVHYTPLDALVHEIIETFDILKQTVRLKNTQEAKARLDYMVDLARTQAEKGTSLNAFAKHLEAVGKADRDIELALKSDFDANTVHFMTIHKSKGLEFPVVYVPHLFNGFMHDTNRERFKRALGFLIPYDNEGYDEHFLYPLYRIIEKTEDVSERLRVLYVALTRAKERVVLPFFEKAAPKTYSVDANDRVDVSERRHYKSFHEILESVKDRFESVSTPINLNAYAPDSSYRYAAAKVNAFETQPVFKTYRNLKEAPVLKKRSAYSKSVNTLLDTETLEALDYGNKLHEMFERIDFHKDLDAQLETLDLNTHEESLIRAFFTSKFITSIRITGVYKEYPFALEEAEGVKSGFIDLLLETDERFYVIDYKLKDIDEEAYAEQISGYVSTVSEVVEKPVSGYLYSIMNKRFRKVI